MEIGSLADWFSAAGTVIAVVVALSTNKIDKKPSLSFYCSHKENTPYFVLNVQNNSNGMVCIISSTDKYVLWPVGIAGGEKTQTLDSNLYIPTSSRVIRSLPTEDGEYEYTYYDTISSCHYEVVVETVGGNPSVKTYSSFYWKWLHHLRKWMQKCRRTTSSN